MIRGFYSGASSLITQQTNMNIIANNVANINTTAFKPQKVAFTSLLFERLNGGAGNDICNGHGVKVQKTGIDFTQGDLIKTDMPLDFAIVGDGFFAIEDRDSGAITYTRDGSFGISSDDSEKNLVNSAGNYVLDADENKIELNEEFSYEKIGVFSFQNPYGLELSGGKKYKATEAFGEAEERETPSIKACFLEGSGVDISEEMVKMIEASKGFSFGSRIVQAADEMEKIINQLR